MQARFIIYCSSLFIFLSPARREECKESEAVQDALTRCGIASTSSGQRERTRMLSLKCFGDQKKRPVQNRNSEKVNSCTKAYHNSSQYISEVLKGRRLSFIGRRYHKSVIRLCTLHTVVKLSIFLVDPVAISTIMYICGTMSGRRKVDIFSPKLYNFFYLLDTKWPPCDDEWITHKSNVSKGELCIIIRGHCICHSTRLICKRKHLNYLLKRFPANSSRL